MSRSDPSGMPNAFTGHGERLDKETAGLVARRAALLGPAYRLFYEEPLHLVRGEGVWLFDHTGRRYLDAYNNVVSLGHCHPRVVEAIGRQAALLNTHTRYLHETILDYAERLLATFPPALDRVMFTCSGSEANDLALRIAQACTGETGVLVTEHAYHGVTHAIATLSPAIRTGDPWPAHVETVPAPGRYRHESDPGAAFAAGVERAIRALAGRGVRLAAMFCDTLFSSDGLFPSPAGFLQGAANVVQAAGGLFVVDEVQAGFGRTGEAMWGFGRHGVQPDLVTLGKPMGNGHPVGGVVMKAACAEEFGRRTRYFNTFGGNPVSMAAALATLGTIEDEALPDHALEIGRVLAEGFERLERKHTAIGAVRGVGCFWALDIVRDRRTGEPDAVGATALVNNMRRKAVLISATGPGANVLKIRPPLVFSRGEAELLIGTLDACFDQGDVG